MLLPQDLCPGSAPAWTVLPHIRGAGCASSGSDGMVQNHTPPPYPALLVTLQLPDLLLSFYGTYVHVKLPVH